MIAHSAKVRTRWEERVWNYFFRIDWCYDAVNDVRIDPLCLVAGHSEKEGGLLFVDRSEEDPT